MSSLFPRKMYRVYGKSLQLIFLFLLVCSTVISAASFEERLRKAMPDAKITKMKARDHFKEVYDIRLTQPLDHKNPAAGSFEQRIYILHTDRKRPVVMETEGYAARLRTNELSRILQANVVIVEYRYAGISKPEKIDWQYLNSVQASADLHRIRRLLRKVYRKKWISTGVSKGGTTALVYKSMYPKDIKVVVPYVAPLALSQEDPRTDKHQMTTGSEECRAKIKAFQRLALTRRKAIIGMIDTFSQNNKIAFSLGTDAAFEYAVLEYPFSFWQWGANCQEIPYEKASDQEIFDYLNGVVSFDFYSDPVYEYFLPSFYQFITELGYYGFPKDHLEDLLVSVKNPSNLVFAPKGVDLTFRPEVGKKTMKYLMKKGNKIIYIYGANDTWTACGITPSPRTNALRLDKKGGSHSTRLADFSKAEQEQVYSRLRKWLKVEVKPLE